MKNKLTHNLGWKFISLFASIILWLIVTTVSNPAVTQSYYNIPVKLLNTETITDSGRVYEIIDESNIIPKVTIKAPRSIISELKSENIIAVADVKDLSSLDTISIDLSTTIYTDKINSIKGSIDTVKLDIQNKKTKTFAITPQIEGEPPQGYEVGDFKLEQNLVRITGAESVVNSISSAVVAVDVSGFETDISTIGEVKLFDSENNVISDDSLTQNIKSVQVDVSILEKKEIPIIVQYSGEAASGYSATGVVETDKDSVVIKGKSSVVKDISAIEIPKEAVTITDQKEDFKVLINLNQYLPNGVTVAGSQTNTLEVTVHIEPVITKHIGLEIDDIAITNVPEGLKATVGMNEGTVLDLIGLATDLDVISKTSLKPLVDVTECIGDADIASIKNEFYNVKISFTLPDRVKVVDPIVVTLHVVKEE
ncbi:MAG: CdaR family protein [Lachnospiraceae bacterium]|nr:CdaR family protein [Lachnospiraceae bacterium]